MPPETINSVGIYINAVGIYINSDGVYIDTDAIYNLLPHKSSLLPALTNFHLCSKTVFRRFLYKLEKEKK